MSDGLEASARAIHAQYGKRRADDPRYSLGRLDVFASIQELDAAIHRELRRHMGEDFRRLRLLEVGSGTGDNLLRMLRWGFAPSNLLGIDLLSARVESARAVIPREVRLIVGDASTMELEPVFDVVVQSTVISSVLDESSRRRLISNMWQALQPGGLLISYDLAWNNPRNRDVRKLTLTELRAMFPGGSLVGSRRLTLAPPIARSAVMTETMIKVLMGMRILSSHRLVVVIKQN